MIEEKLNYTTAEKQLSNQRFNAEINGPEEKITIEKNNIFIEKQYQESDGILDAEDDEYTFTKTERDFIVNLAKDGFGGEEIDETDIEYEPLYLDENRKLSNIQSEAKPHMENAQQAVTDGEGSPKLKVNGSSNTILSPKVIKPEQRIDSDDLAAHVAWWSEHLGKLISNIDNTQDKELPLFEDVCDCVPGFCTCGKQHYVFKKVADEQDSERRPYTSGNKKSEETVIRESFSYSTSCSCVHGSSVDVDTKLSCVEVVAFPPVKPIFPQKPVKRCKPPRYQRTLLIVKPEAVIYKDVILRAIKVEGLDIIDERFVHLTPEQVSEIYTENYGSSYFPLFVQQMSSSPILVLSLGGFNSIEKCNDIIGPDKKIPSSWFYPPSVKRRFGVHRDIYDAMRMSEDFEGAQIEIRYFFPFGILEPILVDSFEVVDYCEKFIHPTLLKALYVLVRVRPPDPLMYLAEWILINNPFQPHYDRMEVSLAPT